MTQPNDDRLKQIEAALEQATACIPPSVSLQIVEEALATVRRIIADRPSVERLDDIRSCNESLGRVFTPDAANEELGLWLSENIGPVSDALTLAPMLRSDAKGEAVACELPDGNFYDIKPDDFYKSLYLDIYGKGTWMPKPEGKWHIEYVRKDLITAEAAPQPPSAVHSEARDDLAGMLEKLPGKAWRLSFHYGKFELLLGTLERYSGTTPAEAVRAALTAQDKTNG